MVKFGSFNVYFLNNQIYSCKMTDKDIHYQNLKIFSLIRLKSECKIAPTRVDFSTPQTPNASFTSIVPSFNDDRSYHTPSFLLPSDKKYYQENAVFQKHQFEEKVQRSVQESSPCPSQEVMIVAPNSNYCQICQQKFSDYFSHIQQKQHRTRSINSEASAMIQQLCSGLTYKRQNIDICLKTKTIFKREKHQEFALAKKKTNRSCKQFQKKSQQSSKGQNNSTGIIQESQAKYSK